MSNVFAFRAATPDGRIDDVVIDAESLDEARARLATRGLYVLEVVESGRRHRHPSTIPTADLALGLRVLADLLDSGLPLARAMAIFADLAPRSWTVSLPGIQRSINEGKGFAAALAAAPTVFPPVVLGIAQAGEAGYGLAPAIRRAAELTEAGAETRSAIRAALAYPAVVALAGMMAITVLVTVVLPRFAIILADLGQSLPMSTQIVLTVANVARGAILPGSVIAAMILTAWTVWTARPTGRRLWHRTLLNTPFIGRIRRGAAVAQMAHTLGALLESGVPLPTALSFAAPAAGDAELERRLRAVAASIARGDPLSRALDALDAATPTAVQLVRAGEESGRLAAMLTHAGRIERRQTDRAIRLCVRALEPALLLVFASMVAFVAAALLQAIYSVRPGA